MALSTSVINFATVLCCVLGCAISFYAHHVAVTKEHDSNYRAMCDINEGMTCSKVLTSRWSKAFGLLDNFVANDSVLMQSNSIYGLAFYAFQLTLTFQHSTSAATAQVIASILANIGSVYLGYILIFVLHDICLVCITIYAINAAILVCNIIRLKQLSPQKQKQQFKKQQ